MRKDIAMKYNRRIFPYYKGIGWDPLFYSAVIFLFLSQVKGIEASKIMYAESFYAFFLLVSQIPATMLIEKVGNKKSLILGSILVTIQIGMMIFANSFEVLVIAYCLSAFATAIKDTAQYTLLYDATKVCKGKNSFGNIDAAGSSLSYVFNAVSSVLAGYLYLINPYIPIILSTFFSLLTVIIAYRFEEVEIEQKEKLSIQESFKDIEQGFKFIVKSKRLRSFFLFNAVFVGVLTMVSTYEKSLLTELNVAPQYFGIIFAGLIMVQCFSVCYQDKIHNTFRNRTFAFLSLPMFISFIVVGSVVSINFNSVLNIFVVIFAFFVQHFLRAPFWVLKNRYATNFTNSDIRTKILSATQIIEGLGQIIVTYLGGLLLEYYSTSMSYIIVGVSGFLIISLILIYMKTRFGLLPEEYDKKDIEYVKDI